MNIIERPSPNFNDRKHPLSILVLHYTGMETGQAAIERLCDAEAGVSAHYVVDEAGDIYALVPEVQRAWHAGKGGWRGLDDINSRSIGIEIVNGGHNFPLQGGRLPPYPDVQIQAVITLCAGILSRHSIAPCNIVGHSDIAPSRKEDPGEHFPWARLAAVGISLFASHDAEITAELTESAQSMDAATCLQEIGYPVDDTTTGTASLSECVLAFQRRFLPDHLTGDLDDETRARLKVVHEDFSKC